MKGNISTKTEITQFEKHLRMEEKSEATIEKYLRDVTAFMIFLNGNEISKEAAISYKQHLIESGYAVRSINSIIASLNSLFGFLNRHDCKIKSIMVQMK